MFAAFRHNMCTAALSIIIFIFIPTLFAHQQPSFPGQNAQQPPQQHHEAHATGQQQQYQQQQQQQYQANQQPDPAHPNTPPANTNQFGGDQAQNAEHIKEHLDGKVDPTANMTPEQLQFHYFNMHDLDKNGRLDGIELIKAITHFHGEDTAHPPPPMPGETELEQMIDSIMREDDYNNDGYIDYGEFLKAQKQRDEQARMHQQQQPPPPQQQQQRP